MRHASVAALGEARARCLDWLLSADGEGLVAWLAGAIVVWQAEAVISAAAITDTAEPLNSLLKTRTGFLSSRLSDCILTTSTDWIIWGLPRLLCNLRAEALGGDQLREGGLFGGLGERVIPNSERGCAGVAQSGRAAAF